MKHRHLTHEGYTLATIEDILARGNMADWAPLIGEIQRLPFGETAEKTLEVCRSVEIYGASKPFPRLIARARAAQSGLQR